MSGWKFIGKGSRGEDGKYRVTDTAGVSGEDTTFEMAVADALSRAKPGQAVYRHTLECGLVYGGDECTCEPLLVAVSKAGEA